MIGVGDDGKFYYYDVVDSIELEFLIREEV